MATTTDLCALFIYKGARKERKAVWSTKERESETGRCFEFSDSTQERRGGSSSERARAKYQPRVSLSVAADATLKLISGGCVRALAGKRTVSTGTWAAVVPCD